MEVSLPGSSVHGILQARILEWAAISSSREPYRPRYRTWISCIAGRFFTVCSTRETCYKVSALVLLLLKTNDFHGEKHFFLMRTFFMLKTFICWVLFYESGSLLLGSEIFLVLMNNDTKSWVTLLLLFRHQVMSNSLWPETATHQASLSFTISQSLPKFMFIELVMPSNHLIFCHPLSLLLRAKCQNI